MANVANVIAGSALLYLAPKGTALPSLLTHPINWAGASFDTIGYTSTGVQLIYTPTFKDITVDEEMSPVNQILSAEKAEVKVDLAEATIQNLQKVITGSTLTPAGGGRQILTFGSPTQAQVTEWVLGFEGPSPEGSDTAVGILYRVKNTAAVTIHYQRADKVVYSVTWTALADSTKPSGQRLGQIDYYTATGS